MTAAPDGVTQQHWEAAAIDASLGVGHIWYDVKCPAYRTLDPADCNCMAYFLEHGLARR